MTVNLFIVIVTILSLVSSLVTEAIKKITKTEEPTVVVAVVSAIIGWLGGVFAYIIMGIPFTAVSIVCLILLAPIIFLTATLGYDKVMEIIKQIITVK